MLSLQARPLRTHPALSRVTECRKPPALLRRMVMRSAAGPGGVFDESPTEPITPQTRQISEELMASMSAKIKTALETDRVQVKDVYGDYQHVSIDVVSAMFEDKTTVQRQRMVYKVRSGDIHGAHVTDDVLPLTSWCLSVYSRCNISRSQRVSKIPKLLFRSCRQYGKSYRTRFMLLTR